MDFILAIWGVSAAAVTISAVQKHRSGGLWLILGCLFGPAAVLAIWLTRDSLDARREADVRDGRLVECLECGELIRPHKRACRHCGRAVLPPA